jgi:hypothetical protein
MEKPGTVFYKWGQGKSITVSEGSQDSPSRPYYTYKTKMKVQMTLES